MLDYMDYIDMSLFSDDAIAEEWIGSTFFVLRKMHVRRKGSRMEKQVMHMLQAMGRQVRKKENPGHDCVLDGIRTEIKGSCKNDDTGEFSFLQIRPNDDYEDILLLFVYPNTLSLMSIPKENVLALIEEEHKKWTEAREKGEKYTRKISPQHSGARGAKQDYSWYTTEQGVLDQGGFYVQ